MPDACPSVPVGTREFQAEVSWDLPSLASGATARTDVTVTGSRQGDIAQASLVSSTRFIDLTAFAWTNNTMRVMARNLGGDVRSGGGYVVLGRDEAAYTVKLDKITKPMIASHLRSPRTVAHVERNHTSATNRLVKGHFA